MYVNVALIIVEAIAYFAIMTALLHLRRKIGLGVFICMLGVMHFLETYLAATSLIMLPFGITAAGSAVFFSGKLMMILALYMEEDASVVRQPIYGLLIGNLLIVSFAAILQFHQWASGGLISGVDAGFLDEMGALMIWGTLLLYIDSLGIVLLYERLGIAGIKNRMLRMFVSGAALLAFDQIGFFALLNHLYGAGVDVFWGGLVIKIGCAALYSVMLGIYFNSTRLVRLKGRHTQLGDLFQDLTFRERYEKLLLESGIDGLTGALNRDRFDQDMPHLLEDVRREGVNAFAAIIDIDLFKRINDVHGHLAGDEILKDFAKFFLARRDEGTRFYRYGGEEFVLFSAGYKRGEARALLDKLRRDLAEQIKTPDGEAVTFSAGVAELDVDGGDCTALLAAADLRLYAAKASGRNKVC